MFASFGIFGITSLREVLLSIDGKDEFLATLDTDKNLGR
jgi:hypothetical protein